ncbi:MAG: hypothetical protein ABIO24_03080 [Saprospiraceae bacterium]
MHTSDYVSGVGVLLILTAFFLTTLDRMSTEGRAYFALNFSGGFLAAVGAWMVHSVPFLVMEVTWTVVAALGFWRSFRK